MVLADMCFFFRGAGRVAGGPSDISLLKGKSYRNLSTDTPVVDVLASIQVERSFRTKLRLGESAVEKAQRLFHH